MISTYKDNSYKNEKKIIKTYERKNSLFMIFSKKQ